MKGQQVDVSATGDMYLCRPIRPIVRQSHCVLCRCFYLLLNSACNTHTWTLSDI